MTTLSPTSEVGLAQAEPVCIANGGVLGHSYYAWRRLQHGQEEVIRWQAWRNEFPELRPQNGYQHQCSVTALVDEKMILMNSAGAGLDEALVLRCAFFHDVAEGLLKIDVPAPKKTDLDDRNEYMAFRDWCIGFGPAVWTQRQKIFLLQTCIKNPACFPEEARVIMAELAQNHRKEALFFRGIEMLDYLYYAYEGAIEQGVDAILQSVSCHHLTALDKIAVEMPQFGQTVWTPKVRSYFLAEAEKWKKNPYINGRQISLFPEFEFGH